MNLLAVLFRNRWASATKIKTRLRTGVAVPKPILDQQPKLVLIARPATTLTADRSPRFW
jgi:hypothetical protein